MWVGCPADPSPNSGADAGVLRLAQDRLPEDAGMWFDSVPSASSGQVFGDSGPAHHERLGLGYGGRGTEVGRGLGCVQSVGVLCPGRKE